MKWGFPAIILSSALLGLTSAINNVYAADQQQSVDDSLTGDALVPNYEEPKNIMFAAMTGGASHVTWTLSISDELSKRGHNITFVTRV
jgi:hypothetical protein